MNISSSPLAVAHLTLALVLGVMVAVTAPAVTQAAGSPKTVQFWSADGTTELTGYLFAPAGKPQHAPAVVLLHGRGGAYSSLADGNYSAATITKRIRGWAELLTSTGYYALVVDSFGPRGFPGGFEAGTNGDRPDEVDEVTVRPLDAYGALRYLRTLDRVESDHIAVLGWSNGGSTAIASMHEGWLDVPEANAGEGFATSVALYPGCGLHGNFDNGFNPYAPVRIFIGTEDEEVSLSACKELVNNFGDNGAGMKLTVWKGATHDFDDPGQKRSSVPDNARAADKTRSAVLNLLNQSFGN